MNKVFKEYPLTEAHSALLADLMRKACTGCISDCDTDEIVDEVVPLSYVLDVLKGLTNLKSNTSEDKIYRQGEIDILEKAKKEIWDINLDETYDFEDTLSCVEGHLSSMIEDIVKQSQDD